MSQVQTVKEATDIVQLIHERITLQRSGNSWRGLCPFHGEKSPSFFVNEQFQRYKCFGCGESGDAFTFLEKYEGMTFGEALTTLAKRAGIELTEFKQSKEDDDRARFLQLLTQAKEYYHYILTSHPVGEPARQYLKQRGITKESIMLFQLGYAPPEWDGLLHYLTKKKHATEADIKAIGLIITGQHGRSYDRFRDRIMFPLKNHRGQVVGFSGRVLNPSEKEAKYINTPETSLYHKSKLLFGFSELYQEIRKQREVLVMEGEFDVISSAQAHVNHVVAVKGSVVTADHFALLKRAVDRVILSLDADSAGREASKRAITLAKAVDIEVRVLVVPSGKDPDELARTNPGAWREASKTSISVYEFLIQSALKLFDPATPEGKRAIMKEVGPAIAEISLVVEQDFYIKRLSELLRVSPELVRQDVQRISGLGQKAGSVRVTVTGEKTPTQSFESQLSAQKLATQTPEERQAMQTEQYLMAIASHGLEQASQSGQLQQETLWWHRLHQVPWQVPLVRNLVTALWPQALGALPAWVEFQTQTVIALLQGNSGASLQPTMRSLWKLQVQQLSPDLQELLFSWYQHPEYEQTFVRGDLEKEWRQAWQRWQRYQVQRATKLVSERLQQISSAGDDQPDADLVQAELLTTLAALHRKSSQLLS